MSSRASSADACLKANRPTILFEHSLYRLKETEQRKKLTGLIRSLSRSATPSTKAFPDNKLVTTADLDKDADFIARAGLDAGRANPRKQTLFIRPYHRASDSRGVSSTSMFERRAPDVFRRRIAAE